MPIDIPPKLWLPPKPAIIRPAPRRDLATFPFPVFAPSGVVVTPTLSFEASVVDASNATTYSGGVWNGVSIGTAHATRRIILGIVWRAINPRTISSLTIGGVSCSERAIATNADNVATIWITDSAVSSGTTANIVLTMNNALERVAVAVWSAINLSAFTATDTASSVASPSALNMDFAAAGVGVAVAFSQVTSDTFVWTGMTERVTTSAIETNGSWSAADYTATGAETNRTITCTYGTGTARAAAAAAFR